MFSLGSVEATGSGWSVRRSSSTIKGEKCLTPNSSIHCSYNEQNGKTENLTNFYW